MSANLRNAGPREHPRQTVTAPRLSRRSGRRKAAAALYFAHYTVVRLEHAQAVCQNHIVWDAIEVTEFTRKHTANVHDGLREIRRIIETLVEKRDARRGTRAGRVRLFDAVRR